ncbi:UDP-glucose flavonoid 3-O-glucosyltransferase 7-like [Ananas comosus]|uniref:UDP-glucose flavonoid 3-O-glucosyltransferase 7-like n=1 Tax=Ananas comosus TaxID=4615 RepID=A0A6P5FZI7_ANACO|nr:UDP-glucose flavonoid 3-O-glucosyltransferase 7-like [Ananas comosus]
MDPSAAASAAGDDDAPHVVFFPLMNPGNTIPMVDVARFLARRGVRCTIATTPANAASIRRTVDASAALGHPAKFFGVITSLHHLSPDLSSLLAELRPDALVSPGLLPWTVDVAAEIGIPRLLFDAAGAFPYFVFSSLGRYFPLPESVVVADLPHPTRVYRETLPETFGDFPFLQRIGIAGAKSLGVVTNTFREMEPEYVDRLKARGRAWCVGPVALLNPADRERILGFLSSHPAGSVVYACFGSMCRFGAAQLRAIARGLEASGRPFLWAVRRTAAAAEALEGDEGGVRAAGGRGMVVVGWVPQVEVLGHAAVGWFVTHCGWNSIQEAVCAGKPMVTWPLGQDQFVNQELVVEVMGVGVRMWAEGVRRIKPSEEEEGEGEGRVLVTAAEVAEVVGKRVLVTAAEVAEVVGKAGGGAWEAAERARERVKDYSEKARRAVAEGGSTYEDIAALIKELEAARLRRKAAE